MLVGGTRVVAVGTTRRVIFNSLCVISSHVIRVNRGLARGTSGMVSTSKGAVVPKFVRARVRLYRALFQKRTSSLRLLS